MGPGSKERMRSDGTASTQSQAQISNSRRQAVTRLFRSDGGCRAIEVGRAALLHPTVLAETKPPARCSCEGFIVKIFICSTDAALVRSGGRFAYSRSNFGFVVASWNHGL